MSDLLFPVAHAEPRRVLSLIGLGAFARFAVPHLRPHFEVVAHDAREIGAEAAALGVRAVPLAEAAGAEVVVLAVPAQHLEAVLVSAGPRVRPGALVLDVCSVKMLPLKLMLERLPGTARIVGTHPLFGPQSGRDGIAGLPIALCPVRADETTVGCVRGFLAGTLGLKVFDITPEAHDREMACVQALTHYISRAIGALDLPATALSTRAYTRLLDMKRDLQSDSMDLFFTIERSNPFAAAARERFRNALDELERAIGGDRGGG